MYRFGYRGPVMIFDTCVANDWKAETVAATEKKAKSNLAYQYKKQNNLVPGARVALPGKLILIE